MNKGSLPEKGAMTSKMTKADMEKFKTPALICQICGEKMSYTQEWAKWERKWSMHRPCYDNALNQLDRETGIATERKQEREYIEKKMAERKAKYGI